NSCKKACLVADRIKKRFLKWLKSSLGTPV
ncbi:MAG: hypothetical protein ACI92C_002827, partial [Neolewinella sp.]